MQMSENRFVTMMIVQDLNFLVRSTGGGAICVLKQTHHNPAEGDGLLDVKAHGALGFSHSILGDR